jgi:uncharacterized protein with HEPN domain
MPIIDDNTRLHHIVDAASKAVRFSRAKKRSDLDTDEILGLALVRLMEVIGAAAGISEQLKEKYPEIVWREMAGMRNRLIHGYFEVDLDIVWQTVKKELPALIREIKKVLNNESWSNCKIIAINPFIFSF